MCRPLTASGAALAWSFFFFKSMSLQKRGLGILPDLRQEFQGLLLYVTILWTEKFGVMDILIDDDKKIQWRHDNEFVKMLKG